MEGISTSGDVSASGNHTVTRGKRAEFLLEMYKQMMADINRHIIVVWQSVGVVVGAFGVMGLVEKNVISESFAATFIVAICAWSLSLLIDSSYWYNRNLCIVANIERLFLTEEDLRQVHYYFGSHRPKNRMISTIWIQFVFGVVIAIVVIVFHFVRNVAGTLSFGASPNCELWIPYVVTLCFCVVLWRYKVRRDKDYSEFIENSPGVPVDSTGIKYGGGHGFGSGGG